MSRYIPPPTVEEVLAKAKLPFELEPGQRVYLSKVCADRRVKDVWIARYTLGGTILLRWDMRYKPKRALVYYPPEKRKTLTRRTRLACPDCGSTGMVGAENCTRCAKWVKEAA